MKITEINFIKTIIPKGSSGTGYSQPDVFEIAFDNGFKTECIIDCWYRPDDKEVFIKSIEELLNKYTLFVDNVEEAYQMYKNEKMFNKSRK